MKIDILTLFPNMFDSFLSESIIKRALEKEKVSINLVNIRDYSNDKHKKVDDTPYGGGAGMVLKPQPIFDAVAALKKINTKVILMCPQGITFNQKQAYNLSKEDHIILISGHYEGFDERIREICDMEISIGDYVLTGGELPSMVVVDAVTRLVDGVIEKESHLNDSFNEDLLDYPQYTKPREFKNLKVPDVLLSGNHKKIEEYRTIERIKRTKKKRPDLFKEKSYKIYKENPYENAIIDKINGYDFCPKNNAKRNDLITVNRMIVTEPNFKIRIAKKNIEKKLQLFLKEIMLINEDGSEDENANKVLGEAERLKSLLKNNYLKLLESEYITNIEKRIEFVIEDFKMIKEREELKIESKTK